MSKNANLQRPRRKSFSNHNSMRQARGKERKMTFPFRDLWNKQNLKKRTILHVVSLVFSVLLELWKTAVKTSGNPYNWASMQKNKKTKKTFNKHFSIQWISDVIFSRSWNCGVFIWQFFYDSVEQYFKVKADTIFLPWVIHISNISGEFSSMYITCRKRQTHKKVRSSRITIFQHVCTLAPPKFHFKYQKRRKRINKNETRTGYRSTLVELVQ